MAGWAELRFYEELNDFLSPSLRKRSFPYKFEGTPSVKDSIEAVGVPHTEVDLILVNGDSVSFGHHLRDGDRVAVYPMFESLDIAGVQHLRPEPLREPRFVLDVHLGKLARRLRLLGFDAHYRNDFSDPELIPIAIAERRAILTRDLGILKNGSVERGYFLRSQDPQEQLREVLDRFDLFRLVRPFSRCIRCNGLLAPAAKEELTASLQPLTRRSYEEFSRCMTCGRIYWKGAHYRSLVALVERSLPPHRRIPNVHTDAGGCLEARSGVHLQREPDQTRPLG